jgi:hypothetical protein
MELIVTITTLFFFANYWAAVSNYRTENPGASLSAAHQKGLAKTRYFFGQCLRLAGALVILSAPLYLLR